MKNIVFFSFLLFSVGCHKKGEDKEKISYLKLMAPPPLRQTQDSADKDLDEKPSDAKSLLDTSRKIIKNGEIRFEASSLRVTRKRIISLIEKFNGYVAEENEHNGDDSDHKEIELRLRLPAKNFDSLLDSITAGAGKIDSKNISVTDVTTRYINIKTALANKRILEKTYVGLLSKVSKISDVLQIENKLTGIHTTIDSTQGELNYLLKQVAYSSLSVTFYSKQIPLSPNNGLLFKLKSAMNDGWELLQNTFFGLLAVWPFLILLIIAGFTYKGYYKRK